MLDFYCNITEMMFVKDVYRKFYYILDQHNHPSKSTIKQIVGINEVVKQKIKEQENIIVEVENSEFVRGSVVEEPQMCIYLRSQPVGLRETNG